MNEKWELANNIELLTQGAIEKGNLDTCMIYGISGNCGKNCPKFKDKTCEEYLTTLENEYNNLQSKIDKAIEYIEKDTRWFDSEYASVYGELCDCKGYNANRLEVMVNPNNLLKILKEDK